MDTNEDTGAGAGLAPTYPIYDRSGVSEVAHSFGEKPSSSAGGGVLVYDCSASDQQKLAKQTQVETIMAAVTAMRTELGRSPKDLAAAAYVCHKLICDDCHHTRSVANLPPATLQVQFAGVGVCARIGRICTWSLVRTRRL